MANRLYFNFNIGDINMATSDSKGSLRVLDYSGIEASDYDNITIESPLNHGSIILRQNIRSRYITFVLSIEADNRDMIIRFFNPLKEGILTVHFGNISRQINFIVDSLRIPAYNTNKANMIFTLSIKCPYPLFRSIDDFGYTLTNSISLENMPLVWQVGDTHLTDYRVFSTDVAILNDGDIECGIRLNISMQGQVVNPIIFINNNHFIRIIHTFQFGDLLEINTNPLSRYIKINGENRMNTFDRNGIFPMLEMGENILSIGAQDGVGNIDAKLYFHSLYLGI